MFKKEVGHLVLLRVLEVENDSEWGAPSFARHKHRSNQVCFLSEFINLNKRLKKKPYPMTKINEMLLKLEGFQYATPLDLNTGYDHIQLSENASNLYTIIPLWGKYRYKYLPKGLTNSSDIFQQKMNDLFHRFEFICAYIDKLLILTKVDWTDHVQQLELTLNKMNEKGLKYNIEKAFFGQTEMEYLVFWVTHDGVKPISRKIESTNNMNPTTSQK